jgi:hypothetical protein
MPLNFPDTPVINTTYIWDGNSWTAQVGSIIKNNVDGGYVFGSAYTSVPTAVNPYPITWTAPAGANWSSLGHTVSSLAIGF